MDDRMLDGDRVLWFIGGSPERAREALAAGHAWTPEQRAQLEQIAASAGYSPQQPTGYPPAQQQVPAQEPAPSHTAPGNIVALNSAFRGDDAGGAPPRLRLGVDRSSETLSLSISDDLL